MENDNEVKGEGNQLDFGARVFDSRTGRFLSVDPLIASYPDISPYLYAANNPIVFLDVEGKAAGDFEVVDPPTKKAPVVKNNPVRRVRDAHRIEIGERIIETAFKRGFSWLKPAGLTVMLVFTPAEMGTGDIPKREPTPEQNLRDIIHYTNDPANDLSGDEIKALKDRIDRGVATDNDRLQMSMLQTKNAPYFENVKQKEQIRYELMENGDIKAWLGKDELGSFWFSDKVGLELDLTIPEHLQSKGIGPKIFEHAMNATKASKFTASWLYGSMYKGGMSSNLKQYLEGIESGLLPKDAAWKTKSGQWAKKHGFTNVEVKTKTHGKGIEAVFTK